jgi:hypothetical protein
MNQNHQSILSKWSIAVGLLILMATLMWSSGTALADDPITAFATEPAWRAVYFNNPDLAGQPVFFRNEAVLDHNWGTGSPDASVNSNNFSARWTRIVELPAGTYRFSVTGDDGVRVYVNNELYLNGWWDHGVRTFTVERPMPAGHHEIRVEFYERAGEAVVKFSLETVSVSPPGGPTPTPVPTHVPAPAEDTWRGEYFNNTNLSGAPALVRQDGAIRFDWGQGSPANVINSDNFSVRWTRNIHFQAGSYRFVTKTDDGVRLFVDNRLIIDKWYVQPRSTHEARISLSEGVHTVRMEYYEAAGEASAELSWQDVSPATVGNLITCVPPNPPNYAWIRVYRRDGNGNWYRSIPRGVGSIHASGYLKLDGLPVDAKYGGAGEPYWIEQWIDGKVARSVGNTDRGEPEFRIRPGADNYTPWQCTR